MKRLTLHQGSVVRWLVAIFGAGLAAHVVTVILADSILHLPRWQNPPLHSAVEAAGAAMALMAAYLLTRLEQVREGSGFNQRIAAALVAMGVLDGLHSLLPPGQLFVWLHSSATLFGGVLFALVWFPPHWFAHRVKHWPLWVLGLSSLYGAGSMLGPDALPLMLQNGEFTLSFKILNLLGGLLMLVAMVRMGLSYRQSNQIEDLLFCLQCAVFCFGALIYEKSSLWNASWWGSHLLRLMAYFIALILVTYIDINARKRAAIELITLNNELENRVHERTIELEMANRELERFSYSVSHDLRAPLRAINGFGAALKSDYQSVLDANGQSYLDRLLKASERMSRLIDDLLRFAKLSRQSLEKQTVDMNSLVRAVWAEMLDCDDRQLGTPEFSPLPECYGDSALLRQVWHNLLSNAVKFTCKIDARRIEVFSEIRADEVVYVVRDNGVGFDMHHAHKLFGVFQRLHKAEDFAGTGVGLALSQRIVERHGGRIWAESDPGVSTSFRFTVGKAKA